MPCSRQGNQVHIYNFYQYSWYSFGKQWWNKRSCCVNKQELMKFKCNQMMHSYKFYSFLRDQSLETGWNTWKRLIINKRFYLLTEIFQQPTKIKKFNRLPTKIENFNRPLTKELNFNRQPTSGPPHSDFLLLSSFFWRFVLHPSGEQNCSLFNQKFPLNLNKSSVSIRLLFPDLF